MADYLLRLARKPWGRRMVRALGLPAPAELRRADGPWEQFPLRDEIVVFGGDGELRDDMAAALTAAGARVHGVRAAPEAVRPRALVYDASRLRHPVDLQRLHGFFHGWVPRLSRSGRVVVLGRAVQGDVEHGAAQSALDGFVRSLAKEVGRRGSTAQLIRVEDGAEPRSGPVLSFALSRRSAYVSGQVLHVTTQAVGDLPAATIRPLDGKVALVTGAARGIGAAIAETLAREGASTICLDRREHDSPLDRVAERVGGTALHVDLRSGDAARAIRDRVMPRFGGLDIVVHNAGVTRDKTLGRMPSRSWNAVLDVNLVAVVRVTTALMGGILRDRGRVICMSSVAGIAGNYGQTNYATAKAGLIGYVRTLAPELADRGITVNAVAPGFIETRMTRAVPVAIREVGRRLNALSQGGRPADVAEVVAFLATPAAVGVTGSVVRVCGMSPLGA